MKQAYLEIEDFLQGLTQEGEWDSAGRFGLSLEHAREKLALYTLRNPQDVLLKMVQAGVAAGARQIEFNSSVSRVAFKMRGCSLNPQELQHPFDPLLDSKVHERSRALRHLAVGIHTVVRQRATGITLSSWDGQQGARIHWTSTGRVSGPWTPPDRSEPLFMVEIRRTAGETLGAIREILDKFDILSMIVGAKAAWDDDQLFLMERAIWCPVPLMIRGRWLPRPARGPLRWGASQPGDPGIRSFDPNRTTWPWTCNYGPPCQYVRTGTTEPTVNWVYDGVLLAEMQQRDCWAVVSAQGCNFDLTGLSLIGDARLRDYQQQLRSQWQERS